jgi:F0F1-type ATP synthase membrane subunit b/b'
VSATWVTFLFEAANFLLLAAVLGWLFFRPVRDALERRRSELEGEQRAAADARAEAERALQDARARRSELEDSLEELRRRVQREAENERERFIEAARAQAQRERETLKEELVSLRRAQARSLARDAAFAAREIVERLLEEMQGPDLEHSLLRAACRELEKLRASGPLAPVVIESVRTLDDAALAALAEAAGVVAADAAHRVDADLVAGLRVLTARGLVDASAAGLAAQAERVLVSQLDRENSNRG